MHLLVTTPGQVSDGTEAVDLGQSPGDIVVLSAAASDLAVLSAARRRLDDFRPTLRLASLLQLGHNMSVDLYLENTVAAARLVVVRLLGGVGYWPYGIEQLHALCRERKILLAVVPGDDQPDPALAERSTLPAQACHRIWQYLAQGGLSNAENLLRYACSLLGEDGAWNEPTPLVRAGLYWPGLERQALDDIRAGWTVDGPVVPILFYRALVQSGDTKPVDALIGALAGRGANPLPIFVTSLKDAFSAETVGTVLERVPADVILNCTGFAASTPGQSAQAMPFPGTDCPVLQVILSGGDCAGWAAGDRGLSPRDLAMNVALPEIDGRVITRAVSFKGAGTLDEETECAIVRHEPVPDRVAFVAELACRWAALRRTPCADKRIAIVLANYPNRDGRLGNGVGLDTPAGIMAALQRLRAQGYAFGGDFPVDASHLMARLLDGPTNAPGPRTGGAELTLEAYDRLFRTLPADASRRIVERWGVAERDPFVDDGRFVLPLHRLGNIVIGIQPARGYNIDPVSSYHDPALVPPHGYLAFYFWLRETFGAQAIVHFGKHGNLEWLPGKALALSRDCFPEIALSAIPHIYPFIVNDPGEGTQAKRRAQAVIVDHLTPPLTRAESYGPLRELERLVDEYYQAAGLDPRRLAPLAREILSLSAATGLDRDVGIAPGEDDRTALARIDNYLCELKELQIRDGLHVFGRPPRGRQLTDLLVALTRLPRADGKEANESLIRAISCDLGLDGFDPLDCVLGDLWTGQRPGALADICAGAWRTNGDTVERLERLAADLVAGARQPEPGWERTRPVLDFIRTRLRPLIERTGEAELDGLSFALTGKFVAPGASGAPTRGRLDVLPTGRNFYSVDCRAVPSPVAWQLGWKSAALLIDHYFQEHGAWPIRIALSAWGTANMRTGGDDIAQALALMGAKPVWDANGSRVTGFEIIPASALGRPRVDVVFRVSGFFRDAFPFQLDLIDSAARAVAALEEDVSINPLAAQVRRDTEKMVAAGIAEEDAVRRAGWRVFGSRPGAYGAGLQALIDERCWDSDADLAEAYLSWGGYAYGGGSEGTPAHELFAARLTGVEIVVQNQDNREHDLLDSDDYYQFEGGLAASIRHLSGSQPVLYHNDHSRPESPRIRTLQDEIARIVRARAANPKWIEGVMRHGYKGASEIAATVDYLFAFAATARVVKDHHFDMLFEAYLGDKRVRDFIARNNGPALAEIAARFREAVERELWHPRSNAAIGLLDRLAEERTPWRNR